MRDCRFSGGIGRNIVATVEEWGKGALIEDGDDAAILQVKLGIHDHVQIDVQSASGLGLLGDLDCNTSAGVLYATPVAVEPIVITRPQVQPQPVLTGQELA